MGEKEASYGTTLSQESMKVIAESIGIANLPEEAARELADEVSYRLKLVLQVGILFIYVKNITFLSSLFFRMQPNSCTMEKDPN